MDRNAILEDARIYIRNLFASEASGHDYYHMMRVANTASMLAREEKADTFIVELSSLLHDVDDVKIFPETAEGKLNARSFMKKWEMDDATIERIIHIIDQVSFKGTESEVPDSIEGMCVQDADRLDAIGAIGIARAFSYGGNHNRPLYDPEVPPMLDMDEKTYRGRKSHTLNHFYEKLFLLKDMMNTESGRRLAEKRHGFMESFVSEFLEEWNGVSE